MTFANLESLSSVRAKINDTLVTVAGMLGFSKVVVVGQADIIAPVKNSTLTFVAGANIALTTDGGANSITISSSSGGAGVTNLAYNAVTSVVSSDTGTDATLTLVDGVNPGLMSSANFTKLGAITGANTGDQTSIVGLSGTKAQFDTAVSDGNIQFVGDAPTAHTHLLAAGATDVTITATNLNALDDGLNTTLHFHDADRARAAHTGTQLASTISDLSTAVAATPAVTANTAKVTNATHTGDVTGATALTIANAAVTNTKLANVATSTIKGRVTAATGNPEDLTPAQVRTLINVADGAQVNVATNLTYTAGTRALASSTGTGATLPLFSATDAGLVPLSGGGTANFLRADGAFAAPAGGGDMVLATAQTNSGLKTFLDATFGLRNVVNTFTSFFTNTNTAARTYTLKDASGTVAFVSDITGTNSGTNTGDQTITLTGDVTGTGTGSFAATVAANAITLAKMAQVGTATFLGRATAATGNVESLSVAQTKTVLAYTPADIGAATAAQANATHTGDAAGATALTLATVNANVGAFGSATAVGAFTVNGKGLTTAASAVAIAIPSTQVTDFSTAADARIGAASINALADVIITTPATGQVVKFNGTNWINDTDATVGGGLSDGDKGDITVSMVGTVWNIDAGVVTLAKQADVATGTVFYRKTAAAGPPEVQTLATLKTDLGLTGTNSGDQTVTLTGNVTGTGTGSFATTIANGVVTNAMQANMAAGTIKGNATAGVGAPVDYAPYGLLYATGSSIGVPIASQAQAEAGTTNTDAMTPLRTKQAIDAQIGIDIAMRNNIFPN